MKKKIGVFITVLSVILASLIHPILLEGQSRPKLDCQKMVLAYVKAFETLDYRTLANLMGKEYSQKDESEFKKQLDNPEAKEQLAPYLEMIRLFPKIGEIPDWVTEVALEYEYIEGDYLIEMHGEFVFTGDNWIIQDLEPRGGESLDEEKKKEYASEISPASSEGKKTLDTGLNELITKLISAVKEESWDGVKETGAHPADCGLHPSAPPEEREKVLKLLSQFPSIGPIPAPAKTLSLGLKGIVDNKEAEVEIEFHWPDNKLEILYVDFN
ncbi:MAG: hypothetical protein OEY18_02475 [Candidatus Aminicenantes bacterium]|nr:hypothetical protein [Candidatus Aminicenantes bacterium]MDH5383548.1 hypothetical protein [Candidatus Aminicenantes bacterium]MDH5743441.1 hypothetical protein [Candidatus Aminicenantes bacterium]